MTRWVVTFQVCLCARERERGRVGEARGAMFAMNDAGPSEKQSPLRHRTSRIGYTSRFVRVILAQGPC